MNRRVIQFLLILGMVAAMPRAPAQLPARAADRGTSAARATAPPLPTTPDDRGDDLLPRGCGGVSGPEDTGEVCCMRGVVYADGQPVDGAEVQVENQQGVTVTLATQVHSGTEAPPYYQLSLSAPPLSVRAGELITVTARYGDLTHSLSYIVRPDSQRVDVVLPHGGAEGYQFEKQIRGVADERQFNDPRGLAVDSAGHIYVVDRGNARVLVFGPDKELIPEWKWRNFSYGSLPGQLQHPVGIAVDNSGYVYVADTGNRRIQKFDSTGEFMVAWDASGTDGGQFTFPEGVAVDGDGNVYVADKVGRLMKFSGEGDWLATFDTTNLPGQESFEPIDVSVDPAGDVYVLGPRQIYKFDSSGAQRAFWEGSLDPGYPGAHKDYIEPGGISTDGEAVYVSAGSRIYVFDTALQPNGIWDEAPASANRSGDIATDSNGHLYATDTLNHRILKLDKISGVYIDSWGDYGRARGELSRPKGVAASDGILYVADTQNNRIQVFSSDGTWIDMWRSGDGEFLEPSGITIDGEGSIYVADTKNNRIQKRDMEGQWTVLDGPDDNGGWPILPQRIAVDQAGNLYVTDTDNNRVWERDATGQWTRLDGPDNPIGGFLLPKGIALDPDGNIYVADSNHHRIQKRNVVTGQWSEWHSDMQFDQPDGLSVDSRGRVYVADAWAGRIRKFTPDGALLAEFGGVGAGEGQFGGHEEWLGISIEDAEEGGRLYVADWGNNRVQVFHPMRPIATINYLSSRSTYIPASGKLVAYGMGQDTDESPAIAAYRWTLDRDRVLSTAPTVEISATQLIAGSHRISFAVQDSEGDWSEPVGFDITIGAPPVAKWTMLLYLAGDFADGRLLNAFNSTLDALRRSFNNPDVRIAVQIDGPDNGDTRHLLIAPGSLAASPQITETLYPEQAMDDPNVLTEFVKWGQEQFPADHYYLAIADHGQGIQGLAWDSHPNGGANLTVQELGRALNDPDVAPIDVLHLDACTMDLFEVAYEEVAYAVDPQQRQQVGIMIASQYLGWDYFAYDTYQSLIDPTTSPPDLALGITASYAELAHNDGHPYTIAALDLQQMHLARGALDALADELIGQINAHQLSTKTLDTIRQASQHFDSDGNYLNDEQDMYVDLVDWAQHIHDGVSIPAVQEKADALRAALIGSEPLIITSSAESNPLPPKYARGAPIDLSGSKGVSIFYPQRQDTEAFRRYIDDELFSFTSESRWPDFLDAGRGSLCPGCVEQPLPGPLPPLSDRDHRVFLPIVLR